MPSADLTLHNKTVADLREQPQMPQARYLALRNNPQVRQAFERAAEVEAQIEELRLDIIRREDATGRVIGDRESGMEALFKQRNEASIALLDAVGHLPGTTQQERTDFQWNVNREIFSRGEDEGKRRDRVAHPDNTLHNKTVADLREQPQMPQARYLALRNNSQVRQAFERAAEVEAQIEELRLDIIRREDATGRVIGDRESGMEALFKQRNEASTALLDAVGHLPGTTQQERTDFQWNVNREIFSRGEDEGRRRYEVQHPPQQMVQIDGPLASLGISAKGLSDAIAKLQKAGQTLDNPTVTLPEVAQASERPGQTGAVVSIGPRTQTL